jgi:hypothetical protein
VSCFAAVMPSASAAKAMLTHAIALASAITVIFMVVVPFLLGFPAKLPG